MRRDLPHDRPDRRRWRHPARADPSRTRAPAPSGADGPRPAPPPAARRPSDVDEDPAGVATAAGPAPTAGRCQRHGRGCGGDDRNPELPDTPREGRPKTVEASDASLVGRPDARRPAGAGPQAPDRRLDARADHAAPRGGAAGNARDGRRGRRPQAQAPPRRSGSRLRLRRWRSGWGRKRVPRQQRRAPRAGRRSRRKRSRRSTDRGGAPHRRRRPRRRRAGEPARVASARAAPSAAT